MVYTKDNKEEAKHLIGKKVKCFSPSLSGKKERCNIYVGVLKEIQNNPYYFVIDSYSILEDKESFFDEWVYDEFESKNKACFEIIESLTDGRGNYLLDFI